MYKELQTHFPFVSCEQVVSYERLSPVSDTKEEVMQGEEKLTALQLEYTHLLSSQLESQRQFFENKIAEAQSKALQEVSLPCFIYCMSFHTLLLIVELTLVRTSSCILYFCCG